MEIIQQWQYNGAVHPDMLKDDAFKLCKDMGITAVQSYVTWANIEPRKENFDFSLYDPLVEQLEKHGLGWAPFLIAGPYCATPEWFLESSDSAFFTCLEHGDECKIQSIWNPALKPAVDRFIRAFFEKYHNSAALRSILLGISGNWGESIYPLDGGFITDLHMHLGWWCGDLHAKEHFRSWLIKKFGDIANLNAAWEQSHKSFDEVSFPARDSFAFKHTMQRIWYKFSVMLPAAAKSFIKSRVLKVLHTDIPSELSSKQRQWIDFVQWYVSSMTEWMEFWLAAARNYFPDLQLYVVTGGDGNPMTGADFFSQTRTAAKYRAGFRVTNLSDNYADSFVWSRPVISSCRFYNVPFETEEALLHEEHGIVMRIFDATTSGANGIYFKNLIGYGKDLCTGRYYPPAKPTSCGDVFLKNRHHLCKDIPNVDVAVFYPNTSIMFDYNALALLNHQGTYLRRHVCFDFADEQMIVDGALGIYKILIALDTYFIPDKVGAEITRWIEQEGGIVIQAASSNNAALEPIEKGKGYVLNVVKNSSFLPNIKDAVLNPGRLYQWKRTNPLGKNTCRVFSADCDSGTYFYNSFNKGATVQSKDKNIFLRPHSIIKI